VHCESRTIRAIVRDAIYARLATLREWSFARSGSIGMLRLTMTTVWNQGPIPGDVRIHHGGEKNVGDGAGLGASDGFRADADNLK
jgi:hypothetical protein